MALVKVSYSDLEEAFRFARYQRHYWLDRHTGRILAYSDEAALAVQEGDLDDLPEWMENEVKAAREVRRAFGELPGREDEQSSVDGGQLSVNASAQETDPSVKESEDDDSAYEPDRFVSIERIPSREAFQFMVDFAYQLTDARVGKALSRALAGNKPFRRFKDTLAGFPKEREHWFEYRAKRRRDYIEQWADEQGVELDFSDNK